MLSYANKMLRKKSFCIIAIQYFFAIVSSLFFLLLVIHAWNLKLSIPFFYTWDSLYVGASIKTVMDMGWYLTNSFVGAPEAYHLADYPIAENFNFMVIKFLAYFSHHYAVIFNLFYILTFPMITVTALFVLKRLGLHYPFAFAASLLFALQPYHFFRAQEGHLFLAFYYAVPLIIWLSFLVATNKITSLSHRKDYMMWGIYLLLCILIGSSGIYYAFFSFFFFFGAGLIASIRHKKIRPLWQATIFIFLIATTLIINVLPSLNYHRQFGVNNEVVKRTPFESELYGLKITQLLLPLDKDRIPMLAHFKDHYNNSALFINTENRYTTLGIIASLGFLMSLGIILLGINTDQEIEILSKFNLCAVLLATMGGFGTLFAYSISPMIRVYSRIAIFIAFFSLYTFFFFLQKVTLKYPIFKKVMVTWSLIIFMLAIGIFSQTSSSFATLQNPETIARFKNDEKFIRAIENKMQKGNMIYQLPYVPFPENPPVVSMPDYEHFRAYLHSQQLKWSYGAIKGRPLASWHKAISKLSTKEMLNQLVYGNYSGIYIDRNGYADHGVQIENEISALLQSKPLISENNQFSFFDLRQYKNKLACYFNLG